MFALILTAVACFLLGYYFRDTRQRVKQIEEVLEQKIDKPKEPEEPQSIVIDPLDPVQTAIYEQQQMMKRLNKQ